jgi:hypothetical protein
MSKTHGAPTVGPGGTRGDAEQGQPRINIPKIEVDVPAIETPVTEAPAETGAPQGTPQGAPKTVVPPAAPAPVAPPAGPRPGTVEAMQGIPKPVEQRAEQTVLPGFEPPPAPLEGPPPVSAPPAQGQAPIPDLMQTQAVEGTGAPAALGAEQLGSLQTQSTVVKNEEKLLEQGGLEATSPVSQARVPTVEELTGGEDLFAAEQTDVIANRAVDMEDMVPPTKATRANLPDRSSKAVLKEQREEATAGYGTDETGTAVRGKLSAGWDVKIHEISVSAEQLVDAWRHQTSGLRELMTEYGYDQEQMLANRAYAIWAVTDLFTNNDIEALAMKAPLVDEASVHRRVVRINKGRGIKINPIVFTMWNADFDGDDMILSFGREAIRDAKSAMDFLIGTDGVGKIDPDFFDMAPWGDGTTTVYAHLRELFEGDPDNPLLLTEAELKGLASAIERGWSKDSKVRAAGYRSLLRWSRQIGERFPAGPGRDEAVARILTDIYNQNKDIRMLTLGFTAGWNYIAPADLNGEYGEESQFPELESDSSTPANMKDMERALGTPIGYVPGKNIHFRVTASFLKAARQVSYFMGIKPPGDTFEEKVALMASGIEAFDEAERGVSDWARRLIIESLGGFPADGHLDPKKFDAYIKKFVRRYNYIAYTVNSVTATFNLDDTISPADRQSYVKPIRTANQIDMNRDIRKEFKNVFGSFTMGRLFGKECPNGWENITLDEFVHTNRADATSPAGAKLLGRPSTPLDTPAHLIGRLADLRTSFSKTYNDEFTKSLKKQFSPGGELLLRKVGILRKEQRVAKKNSAQLDADMIVLLDAMRSFSVDIFYFLGFNSPADLERNPLGQKFLGATNYNKLGGLMYEAATRYRFEPVQHAERELRAAKNGKERRHWESVLRHELGEIASSSETWAVIVHDYENGGDVLPRVLLSDMTKTQKEAEIVKLVHESIVGRHGYNKDEVAAGLMGNPKGLYARDRFISDFGHTNLMKNVKAASDTIDRYAKLNWTTMVTDIKNARAGAKPDEMKQLLSRIARDPSILVPIENWQIGDAVLSLMEKSYPSSEKAQQEPEVAYIYSAISNLINAGTWSDLVVGGDFAVGSISAIRLAQSPGILAKAISDPNFAIRVYDGKGSTILSQYALFKKNNPSDKEIWDWLENNPRMAMALRLTTMGNSVNKKTGFSYTNATKTLEKSMYELRKPESVPMRCLKKLADHPGFYAMVALSVPMEGQRRVQLRKTAGDNVWNVIELIRSFNKTGMTGEKFVEELVKRNGLPEGITLDEVKRLYKEGQKATTSIAEADQYDVRDTREYQIGQLMAHLAANLEEYAGIVDTIPGGSLGFPPRKIALDLFQFSDETTLRSYFDAVQVMSGAKTEVSTSVNAAESKKNAALMFLAQYVPKACGAPEPVRMKTGQLAAVWEDHIGDQVFFPPLTEDGSPEWYYINEANLEFITEYANENYGGMVMIEDTAACVDPLCRCARHAKADPSTNFTGLQTTELGRFLTVVRTFSGETLNLKIKTTGDDETDSITKNKVFEILDVGLERRLNDEWVKLGMNPAPETLLVLRTMVAEKMKETYKEMGYGEELTLDDFTALAHFMVRPYEAADGLMKIKLLSIGQLNAICHEAATAYVNELGDQITHQGVLDRMVEALSDDSIVASEMDINDVTALVDVAPKMFMTPRLKYQRMSSTGRNLELAKQIVKENPDVRALSEEAMDDYESILLKKDKRGLVDSWKNLNLFGEKYMNKRYKLRLIGIFTDKGSMSEEFIGPRNCWLLKRGGASVDTIARAYRLGITVLIENPSEVDWKEVSRMTGGEIDERQLVDKGGNRWLIPMFDIRLNGQNRSENHGAFDAGVVHVLPESVYFYFESILNKDAAADAEFIPTKWFSDNITFKRTGTYRLPAKAAFANLIWEQRPRGGPGVVNIDIATRQQIEDYFVDGYVSDTADDAPPELDKSIPLDLGKANTEEGSRENNRFLEDVKVYLSRYHETNEKGMLPSAKPDEIIGWLRAEINGEVRFHPIRMFELGHGAGAPTDMEIDWEKTKFDQGTQELLVEWRSEGSMLGRMFKIFEGGFASNKFMARTDAIDDMELQNGVKIAGYIARQSTSGRRLLMRRQQKMSTLMYMARLSPYGYNFAERDDTFPNDPEIKEALLSGEMEIGEWDKILKVGDIQFYPEAGGERNAFLNDMCRKAVRYKVNPTVVLASRYGGEGGTPSNLWFNFQVLFGRGPGYQRNLMQWLNFMMPTLCPPGLEDGKKPNTLFNANLQVYVPASHTMKTSVLGRKRGDTVTVGEWVDLYGGFHFLDEHYDGHSNSGSTVKSDGIPGLNTLMAGGKELSSKQLKAYFGWGNIGHAGNWSVAPSGMISPDQEPID